MRHSKNDNIIKKMLTLVLGCLVLANALPGDSCQTTAKGIFAKRQTEFEE